MTKEEAYSQVATEIAKSNLDPVSWTKAIEKSEGNVEKAKSLYITIRVNQIYKPHATARNKKIAEAGIRASAKASNRIGRILLGLCAWFLSLFFAGITAYAFFSIYEGIQANSALSMLTLFNVFIIITCGSITAVFIRGGYDLITDSGAGNKKMPHNQSH